MTGGPTRTEKAYYPNGSLKAEVNWVGENIHGITKTWHPNGRLQSEVPVAMSKKHGVSRHWNSAGALVGTNVFFHGTGLFRSWHDNGLLQSKTPLVNEIPNGWQRCWDECGKLIVETFFSKGRIIKQKKAIREAAKIWKEGGPAASDVLLGSVDAFYNCSRLDALRWVSGSEAKPRLGENFTITESRHFVKDLYSAGANYVEAIFPDAEHETLGCASALVVGLPETPESRKRIFSMKARAEEFSGYRPEEDIGQPFLFIAF